MGTGPLYTVIDANLLAPTLTRTVIYGLAKADIIFPRLSHQIINEAIYALGKFNSIDPNAAKRLLYSWPEKSPGWIVQSVVRADIQLRDSMDVHVVETAIAGQAPLILTENLRDFPSKVLKPFGIRTSRLDPLMMYLAETRKDEVSDILLWTHNKLLEKISEPLDFPEKLRRSNLKKLADWWSWHSMGK